MEGLAVDFEKCEHQRESADHHEGRDKQGKIGETIDNKKEKPGAEQYQKLPRRDRTENLVLYFYELRHDILFHTIHCIR